MDTGRGANQFWSQGPGARDLEPGTRTQSNNIYLLGNNRCTHEFHKILFRTLMEIKGARMVCRISVRRTELLLTLTGDTCKRELLLA